MPQNALFTVAPGIPLKLAATEAANLLECARYLNYTGVIQANRSKTGAAQYISAMVRALLDEIELAAKASEHSRL